MGRQALWRKVGFLPQITYFKPSGVSSANLEEERITVEEAEAIRLKDLEELELEDCAYRMNISRTTFSRILNSARKRIADALLSGKAIRIEGGNFKMAVSRYRCINGHEWDVSYEAMEKEQPRFCLTCNTRHIIPLWPYGLGWRISNERSHGQIRQK
jgi:predicted DNA-binding protein (UPF0251 family)